MRYPAGPTANGNTSGCEASDYEGMPAGAIVIVQRGTCSFATKFLAQAKTLPGGSAPVATGRGGAQHGQGRHPRAHAAREAGRRP